jgi:hypothetical protein
MRRATTGRFKSDAVALSEHVGHTVKVTGVVSNGAAHGAKEDAKEKASEHGVATPKSRPHDRHGIKGQPELFKIAPPY